MSAHLSQEVYLERVKSPRGGEIALFPVLHSRVEVADAVKRAFSSFMPTRVAIELPSTLETPYLKAVSRLPKITVITYPVGEERAYLLVEPTDALAEAARCAMAQDIPLSFVDADLDVVPGHFDPCPDPYAMTRIGHRAYMEAWLQNAGKVFTPQDTLRERTMAAFLSELGDKGERVLLVCGAAHVKRVASLVTGPHAEQLRRVRPRQAELYHLAAESLGEVCHELPFIAGVYEAARINEVAPPQEGGLTLRRRMGALELYGGAVQVDENRLLDDSVLRAAAVSGAPHLAFDRQRAFYRLFMEAGRHYFQETGERLESWQKRALFKFLRNWALLEGKLLPDLYQMVEAAKGVVDDNFAHALWRLGVHYSHQTGEVTDLPVATLTADMLGFGSRTVRMRPRHPRRKARPVRLGDKRRKGLDPSKWLDGFTGEGICSYPPEDVVVENFGGWLKSRAGSVLSEENVRLFPFRGSLLDGIDMRETIRRLPEGEIFVKQFGKVKGGMGSVVVIFDGNADFSTHPFAATWLGEHDQESDMAFFATSPLENVVGPGICRVEYGGFLLSYPPLRLFDVWRDQDYSWTLSPAERLLAAAIDYSLEENVIYCAPKPPRAFMKQYASRGARRIIYLPTGSLGARTLKKLRVMHILDGKGVREKAKDYIW